MRPAPTAGSLAVLPAAVGTGDDRRIVVARMTQLQNHAAPAFGPNGIGRMAKITFFEHGATPYEVFL
jgi:hypothetical protein